MIVVDTTILVYAVGGEHELAPPCRRLIDAIGRGEIRATTTAEVVQEFAHVRARPRTRQEAAQLAASYAALFSPLIAVTEEALVDGLRLFESHEPLGAFDAVLAAAARLQPATALVSADSAFEGVPGLRYVDPRDPALWEQRTE